MNTESLRQLIKSRRTCYHFLPKQLNPLTDQEIDLCIEAATWAPNHKLTQPWRFWVISAARHLEFAAIYADNRARKNAKLGSTEYQYFYPKAVDKFATIPQVVFVGQLLSEDKVTQKEDYAACACAIQNFQLMAWQQSIGVQWSTGPILTDLRTYELLGIDSHKIELIGALYMGKIDAESAPNSAVKRKAVSEVKVYVD